MKRRYTSDGVDPKKPQKAFCRQCGDRFSITGPNQKYCCEKCRNYFNNHKGVKTRKKAEDPEVKNLRIVTRLAKGREQFEMSYDELFDYDFTFGLACEVFKSEDGWLWWVFEGYCVSQRGRSTYLVVLGEIGSISVDRRPNYQKRLSGASW
jgi:hypothetical protein